MHKNNDYNKHLKPFANHLRKNMTKAHVLRFTDNEVLRGIDNVVKCIENFIETFETESPPPNPPPAGDNTPLNHSAM